MSARGSLKLFKDLIDEQPQLKEKKQGRSAELHTKRNECLIERYHYYLNFTDKRYMSILAILQEEFFINSDFTIPQVIDDNYESLIKLKSLQPAKDYFKKKWPHLVW
jgi:hypothetical protein